ncbi:hypothetical protein GCM10008018_69730 [Paenibacillus marchantiophytorum]|uniref:Uncharacterized protein n=1 Tax=Paenibacillus marchantiophytorum TaxID=1619310 RepID=A0ABQ1FK05_9BACL|nr:hypothetical protein [Paenibacillus marchantiophytorum]GGA14907.1 hypothetical protein GCM10008018_69730 [Paenibacillus marchantiophytorum]
MSERKEEIKRALQEEKKARSEKDYYKGLYKDKKRTGRTIGIVLGTVAVLIVIIFVFTKTQSGTVAGILIFLLICFIALRRIYLKNVNDEVAVDMYERYQIALRKLSQNPKYVQLRQQALSLGRFYYSSSRPDHKPTVYDETAIANDINAACGE